MKFLKISSAFPILLGLLSILVVGCQKDIPKEVMPTTKNTASVQSRQGDQPCGYPNELCEKFNFIQAIINGGGNGYGVDVMVEGKQMKVVPVKIFDEGKELLVISEEGNYIYSLHSSPYLRNTEQSNKLPHQLTKLAGIDWSEMGESISIDEVKTAIGDGGTIVSDGKQFLDLSQVSIPTDGLGFAESWCEYEYRSNVQWFIDELIDKDFVADPYSLSLLIEDAYDECESDITDNCVKCIDPKCVLDNMFTLSTNELAEYTREILVANYLRVMFDLSEQEYEWFVTGQEHRDFGQSLFDFAVNCDNIRILNDAFSSPDCMPPLNEDNDEFEDCLKSHFYIDYLTELGYTNLTFQDISNLNCFYTELDPGLCEEWYEIYGLNLEQQTNPPPPINTPIGALNPDGSINMACPGQFQLLNSPWNPGSQAACFTNLYVSLNDPQGNSITYGPFNIAMPVGGASQCSSANILQAVANAINNAITNTQQTINNGLPLGRSVSGLFISNISDAWPIALAANSCIQAPGGDILGLPVLTATQNQLILPNGLVREWLIDGNAANWTNVDVLEVNCP